ncbi:MAG: putative glycoside hydrolase [Acidobacteriota bacterium]
MRKLGSIGLLLTFVCFADCAGVGSGALLCKGEPVVGWLEPRVRQSTTESRPGPNSQDSQARPARLTGRVLDATNDRPIPDATVFYQGNVCRTDQQGRFELNRAPAASPVLVKAPGYRQASVLPAANTPLTAKLRPFDAKGLYLTHFGVSSRLLRGRVLGLIHETDLNALVIDVKGDRGLLSSRYEVPLAEEVGALKRPTVKDIKAFLADLHRQDVYVIGRIVVFKDHLLASAHPEWAILDSRTKQPWIDNEGLAWVDPNRREVWEYNMAIAKEAAKAGFDEIQFDYVRFPTDGKISAASYAQPNTMENRVQTINSFLKATYQALLPYNVYFSADVFGYTPWNRNDTDIGQKIEDIAQNVDYLCLMVYPSGYHLGIPGFRNPVAHPREVVYLTMERASKRIGGQSKKLRPWLQNFRDYAFDRRPYTQQEIKLQIQACDEARTSGWLLWDPSNKYRYTDEAMKALKGGRQIAENVLDKSAAAPQPASE